MVDLGGSVGSLTWVVEIIAKSSGFKRYRGKKKKTSKAKQAESFPSERSKQRRENQGTEEN